MNINNGYQAAAFAQRRAMEMQNAANGGNPYHFEHIREFCNYADNLVAGAMAELRAQLPQLVAEAMHSPKVEIEVDEKSYKTAKQKIADLFNMILGR